MKESKLANRVGVYVPLHPAANNRGYILRSRYIVEKRLGRRLHSNEIVHHLNEDGLDDRDENLEVTTRSAHMAEHWRLDPGRPCGRGERLDQAKIKVLRKSGFGYKKIAKLTGYSRSGVAYVCRTLGI